MPIAETLYSCLRLPTEKTGYQENQSKEILWYLSTFVNVSELLEPKIKLSIKSFLKK